MNTYIMIHMGMIEEQQNSGVMFSSPNAFNNIDDAIRHFVSSLIKAIYDADKEHIKEYDCEYVLDFFQRNVSYGITDNVGYFLGCLEQYDWTMSYLNELLEDINSSPMILTICGFEAFLDPFNFNYYNICFGTENDHTDLICDEYQIWIKDIFDNYINNSNYCI